MASRELVERVKCATDHRGAFVAITPKGRKAIKAAAPAHVAAVRRNFIDLLSQRELAALKGDGGPTCLTAPIWRE